MIKMPVSLGVVTDEVSLDLREALAWARKNKLDYIDLRDVRLAGENMSELDSETIGEVAEILAGYNIPVKTICPTLFRALLVPEDIKRIRREPELMEHDQSQYAGHLRMLKRSLELASLFGAPYVRTFAFFRERNPEEVWDELLEAFQLPLEMAEKYGKTLLLENEDMSYAISGGEASRLISDLGSKYLRAIWDPANAWGHRETPFPDGYRQIRPHLEIVHAKDASGEGPVLLGHGAVDWNNQLRALLEDGFNGSISIETHTLSTDMSLMEGSERNLAYLRSRISPRR